MNLPDSENRKSVVLIVDDEPAIRESVAYTLKQNGFSPVEAASLKDARALFSSADLIILDLMLPDGSGLDFLTEVKKNSAIPVIILTSRDEEVEKIVGLETGADDYVTKPFSPREVAARARAVLRRTRLSLNMLPENFFEGPFGIVMDLSYRKVMYNDTEIPLARIEFDLMAVFMSAPKRVFSREMLLNKVWGPTCHVSDRTVDTHLKTLRKKLKASGITNEVIQTVRGVGYRLGNDR